MTEHEQQQDQAGLFDLDEYMRYGRQMIVPQFGIKGQTNLKNAKVLVVGAGGLGSPALAYLAGAGVGTIGIVDGDTVDQSNLHRQIIHATATIGMAKVESAKLFINNLNPHVNVQTYNTHVFPTNIFEIVPNYTVVLDCTDNPATRYLVNDACVLTKIPLVSASALKTEGQLSVLNFAGGPCYRCLFPVPPPPNSVVSCGDGGILGPVVGIMGVYQAIEALKVLTNAYKTITDNDKDDSSNDDGIPFVPSLHLFSAYSFPPWRCIKMRGRKPICAVCGDNPTITQQAIESGDLDYAVFCGKPIMTLIDPVTERISVQSYKEILDQNTKHTLVDVRPKEQFEICSLPNSLNLPYSLLTSNKELDLSSIQEPVYVLCRYGNDSQGGVKALKEKTGFKNIWDISGGLNQWALEIDECFPRY